MLLRSGARSVPPSAAGSGLRKGGRGLVLVFEGLEMGLRRLGCGFYRA